VIIIYGYFRTGTTYFYRLLRSNMRGKVVLYEPDHTRLSSMLENFTFVDPHQPGGFKPFECYSELSPEERKRLKELWVCDPCPQVFTSELKRYVEFLDSCADVIKVNRWGFILGDIMKHLPDVKVVIVLRRIYDVVQSHYNVYRRTGDGDAFDNLRYFRRIMQRVPQRVLSGIDWGNIIDRVVVNYMVTYQYVIPALARYCNRVFVVRYEDAINDLVLLKLSKFLGTELVSDIYIKRSRSLDKRVKRRVDAVLSLF